MHPPNKSSETLWVLKVMSLSFLYFITKKVFLAKRKLKTLKVVYDSRKQGLSCASRLVLLVGIEPTF